MKRVHFPLGSTRKTMLSLNYLTVQDILWINLQVTKRVHHFNYAKLEEATFYQYAYGESKDLLSQAGRFITGFLKMHPFEGGNEATAFIGCLSFLEANGHTTELNDDEALAWFDQVRSKSVSGSEAVAKIAKPDPHFHPTVAPPIRESIQKVLDRFPETVRRVAESDASAAA